MGAAFGGEWIHVYVWLSPFAVHLRLSQHCLLISYTPIQNKIFKKIRKKKKNGAHLRYEHSFKSKPHVGWLLENGTGFPGGSAVKNLPAMQAMLVGSLGREHPLKESMATHSSILGLENPTDRGAWWATYSP